VQEHEIYWGLNPHSRAGGDNLQLLEIVPGHYHFEASFFATNLCNMVGTNPRSQFYKTPPTGESNLTSRPPYSRGNGRTIKRQEFHASRRQARAIEEKEQNATTSPRDNIAAPSPNTKQGRPVTNLGVPSAFQGPNLTETEATLHEGKETDGVIDGVGHPTGFRRNPTPRLLRGHREETTPLKPRVMLSPFPLTST